MINEKTIDKLWDNKEVKIEKCTYNRKTVMFLHVFSRNGDIFEELEDENYDSRMTFFGPAGFKVLYTHKNITPEDYFYALVDHLHADNSVRYKECVEIMSKMTHIEAEMKEITKHFPEASIVAVEQVNNYCWKKYNYFVIKLGNPKIE